MVSIYSICQQVQLMEEAIKRFSHPVIDSVRTNVITDITPQQSSLEVQLYDHSGDYLLQDLKVSGGYTFPGLLLTLHPREKRICIESIYLKPAYYGRGIGTAFVCDMMNGARQEGYEKMRVVADVETNAAEYWKRVHGFETVDELLPLVLEKRI